MHNLSLLDALIVSTLCTIATIPGNSLAVFHWPLDDIAARSVQTAFLLHNIALGIFGIIVWARVSSFGLDMTKCEDNHGVMFVIFGKSIRATNPALRILAIMLFGFLLVYTLLVVALKVYGKVTSKSRRPTSGHAPLSSANPPPDMPVLVREVSMMKKENSTSMGESTVEMEMVRRPSASLTHHRGVIQSCLAFVTPQQLIVTIPYLIYLIITTEQILLRNHLQDQSNQWTLGQTIAMLMIISVMTDFVLATREYGGERRFGDIIKEEVDHVRRRMHRVVAMVTR
ncbi:hypothetical protein JAAARDRAFT_544321 [Jaapia argillacea MUCL 33604]|uniref:Uncharacterized protein n=1 Tax=Jaapia argillacea MUCL 33604 TaxID=933084 RepID=A0A067PJ08_9AGAM|nr:hypothetical protein JAAARDRAFT_544321 [Jaapia argillacea MUCL 33604]